MLVDWPAVAVERAAVARTVVAAFVHVTEVGSSSTSSGTVEYAQDRLHLAIH